MPITDPRALSALKEKMKVESPKPKATKTEVGGATNSDVFSEGNQVHLIKTTSVDELIQATRARATKIDLSRVDDPSRYIAHSKETENGTLPRDWEEGVNLWDDEAEEPDQPDMRLEVEVDGTRDYVLSYGDEQATMLYFIGPLELNEGGEFSAFSRETVRLATSTGLPVYSTPRKYLPVNVRPGDAYLAACYLDIAKQHDVNLSGWFPADVHKDGFPYGDRPGYGIKAMPRAHKKDYPKGDGTFTYDRRVGYIEHGEQEEVYFFGGTGFTAKDITEEEWCNLHHFYINMTGKNREELKGVLQEPAEIYRQVVQKAPLTTLGIDHFAPKGKGVARPINHSYEKVKHVVHRVTQFYESGEGGSQVEEAMDEEDRQLLLNNLPCRGKAIEVGTYDAIGQAAISGAVFKAASRQLARKLDMRSGQKVAVAIADQICNTLSAWMSDAEMHKHNDEPLPQPDAEPVITTVGNLAAQLQRQLVDIFSQQATFSAEMRQVMEEIPAPHLILQHLPDTVMPSEVFELSRSAYVATHTTTTESRRKAGILLYQPREDWRRQVNTSSPDYYLGPPKALPYLAPYATSEDSPVTDQLLSEALSGLEIESITTSIEEDGIPKPGGGTKRIIEVYSDDSSPSSPPAKRRVSEMQPRIRSDGAASPNGDGLDTPPGSSSTTTPGKGSFKKVTVSSTTNPGLGPSKTATVSGTVTPTRPPAVIRGPNAHSSSARQSSHISSQGKSSTMGPATPATPPNTTETPGTQALVTERRWKMFAPVNPPDSRLTDGKFNQQWWRSATSAFGLGKSNANQDNIDKVEKHVNANPAVANSEAGLKYGRWVS